jgi:hypothetical protein
LDVTLKAVPLFTGMTSFFAWLRALSFEKRSAEVMEFDYESPNAGVHSIWIRWFSRWSWPKKHWPCASPAIHFSRETQKNRVYRKTKEYQSF